MSSDEGRIGFWTRLRRLGASSLLGILAAASGLGAGELVAAATGPTGSPVLAVGAGVIRLTPTSVEQWAIRTFGTNDKLVLIIGVLTILVLAAALAGILARRRLPLGGAIVVAFGVAGVVAALTSPASTVLDAVPSVVAGLVALAVLVLLVRLARRAAEAPEGSDERSSTRRTVLLGGLGALGFAVVSGVVGRLLQASQADVSASRAAVKLPKPADPAPPLPAGYQVKIPGISDFYSNQKDWDYYVIDTALNIPAIPAEDWTLRIGGDVKNPIELSFADVLSRDLMERDLTLCCVSNSVGGRLTGNARWLGLSLGDLLKEAGVSSNSDQLLSRSTDGMTIGTPMEAVLDGRDAMLVVGMNGKPLEAIHGFPARLIVPGLYGYTSATKWVIELEATRYDKVDSFWTARDWDPTGVIKTMSRIDTPRPFAKMADGDVTVAGVAWAQHRGISAVEVRVDGGKWQEADLTAPLSKDTWRQWHTKFKLRSGNHRFEVRAIDGDGKVQEEKDVPPFPAGASGWHSVVTLVQT